jgi:ABC-type Fe3+/spermidine/putrescine transport system ATPase subunit
MNAIEIKNFFVWGHDGNPTVVSLNFAASQGELVYICGPSGCGKSTLLNAIAGFSTARRKLTDDKNASSFKFRTRWFGWNREITSFGEILVDGSEISRLEPKDRPIGVVFQKHGTYPHLTALQNISFPLICKKHGRDSANELARHYAEMCGLRENHLHKKVSALSGGEAQRVGIAKMLAKKPRVALLDEAFSHLDQMLRDELLSLVKKIVMEKSKDGVGVVFLVSHDWREARLADRVMLMNARTDRSPKIRNFVINSNHPYLHITENEGDPDYCQNEKKWMMGLSEHISGT